MMKLFLYAELFPWRAMSSVSFYALELARCCPSVPSQSAPSPLHGDLRHSNQNERSSEALPSCQPEQNEKYQLVTASDAEWLAGAGAVKASAGLLAALLRLRSVEAVSAAVSEAASKLGSKKAHAAIFVALETAVEQGLCASFAALEVARWLCLDARFRHAMLTDTAFLAAVTGAALASARTGSSITASVALAVLQRCLDLDAVETRLCVKRLRLVKILAKVPGEGARGLLAALE